MMQLNPYLYIKHVHNLPSHLAISFTNSFEVQALFISSSEVFKMRLPLNERGNIVHVDLTKLVEASILLWCGDYKVYPFLQKSPRYMKDLFGSRPCKFQS